MIRELRIKFLKFRINVCHIRCALIEDAVFRAATARQKDAITHRRNKMNRKYQAAKLKLAILETQGRSVRTCAILNPPPVASLQCSHRSASELTTARTVSIAIPRIGESNLAECPKQGKT